MWHDDEAGEPAVPVGPGDIARLVAAYREAVKVADHINAAFSVAGIPARVVPTLTAAGRPTVRLDVPSPEPGYLLAEVLSVLDLLEQGQGGVGVA